MRVYFDNAATTPVDPQVFEAMSPYLTKFYGNPSSTHAYGREAKSVIESGRKKIAEILQVSPAEIFFTSGGTEADNTALWGLVKAYDIKHIITSPIEHHAVLHTSEAIAKWQGIEMHLLDIDSKGNVDINYLVELLKANKSSLVSLMHANNEIGNLINLEEISALCIEYGALLHSDTVQTVGRYEINLKNYSLAAIAASGHKFHGPKGTGFLYVNGKKKIGPFILGGGQERNMRAGTENVAGIVGICKAFEIAHENQDQIKQHVQGLKDSLTKGLKENIRGIEFNGLSENPEKSLYSVLNVSLPVNPKNEMLLFQLDLEGIAASGGSACGSGALKGSHVLSALRVDPDRSAIRFSFSKFNTQKEIAYVIKTLSKILS